MKCLIALTISLSLALNSCTPVATTSTESVSPSKETNYRTAIYTSGPGTYTQDEHGGPVKYTNQARDVWQYVFAPGQFIKHPSGETCSELYTNGNYKKINREARIEKPISQSQLPRGRFPVVSYTPIIGTHFFNGKLNTVSVDIVATHFRIRADKKIELAVRVYERGKSILDQPAQIITPDYLGTFDDIDNILYIAEIDKTVITHDAAGPGALDMSALNFDDMETEQVAVETPKPTKTTAAKSLKPTTKKVKAPVPKKAKSGISHGVNGWRLIKHGNMKMVPLEQRINCAG